jgi:hypothetical protein
MKKILLTVAVLVLLLGSSSYAQTSMESTNYIIQFDSINAGGLRSTSSSYTLEDTASGVGTGDAASTNYVLRAGYQQMTESYLSITASADVNLGSLSGLINDTTEASSTWTVLTDNAAGYQLTVAATSSPALRSGPYSFADYAPSGAAPDFVYAVPSNDSVFGFSPEGADIVQKYKDNGSACNTGSGDTASACWNGFSTTPELIAEGSSSNHPLGTATTIRYKAGNGASHVQEAGNYTASITVTATSL